MNKTSKTIRGALTVLAAFFVVSGTPSTAQTNYYCTAGGICPFNAFCMGDFYERDRCRITCFGLVDPNSGEITEMGSADCGDEPF